MTCDRSRTGLLDGKVAVVTGAAGGIGQEAARRFALEGGRVCCVDRTGPALQRLVDEIEHGGGSAISCVADISTRDGNEEMVGRAVEAFGGLDVLHANAAVQVVGRLEATTERDWDALYQTNLRGVAFGVDAALPAMRSRGGGAVVITASLLGIVGDPDLPAYGAMKGGLLAMSRSLAAAHGPENIRFNTICPGDVETPMLTDFFLHQEDGEAARARVLSNYPLGRFASPGDVAAVAAFLASDDAAYLTGIDIPVDGGLLAQIY